MAYIQYFQYRSIGDHAPAECCYFEATRQALRMQWRAFFDGRIACRGNCPHDFASRLRNLREVPVAQSVCVHQVRTHSQSECSGGDELGRVEGIHPAGWNQGSVREGSSQGPQIFSTANIAAGKNLDQLCAVFLSTHEFGWCQRSGNGELRACLRDSENRQRHPRTYNELGSRTNTLIRPLPPGRHPLSPPRGLRTRCLV